MTVTPDDRFVATEEGLEIRGVLPEDKGNYTCLVENERGQVLSHGYLTVQGRK